MLGNQLDGYKTTNLYTCNSYIPNEKIVVFFHDKCG